MRREGMYPVYSIFGTPVSSQLPLSELPLLPGETPVFRVEQRNASPLLRQDFRSCYRWRDAQERIVCEVSSAGTQHLLEFAGQAKFLISANGAIEYLAAHDVADGLIRHLLLSQVLPRCLAHRGALLLHASAVTLPGGKTVAFVGESGRGKSTLASYCYQSGARLLDDDCILLGITAGTVTVAGGVPTVRLYPDSARALDLDGTEPCVKHGEKRQIRLGDEAPAPQPLDALFLLAAGVESDDGEIAAKPAAGQAAVMALVESAFTLDPADHVSMTHTLDSAANVLRASPWAYHLHYPRNHDALERVFQTVCSTVVG